MYITPRPSESWIDRTFNVAVLIDAENVPAKHASAIFAEIAQFGEAAVRRVYHAGPSAMGWEAHLRSYAIETRREPSAAKGKNAADIALVIDAMDLLAAGDVDAFALISSDSDFTGLAKRLRQSGKQVFAIGNEDTSATYRAACTAFLQYDELTAYRPPPPPPPPPVPPRWRRALGWVRGLPDRLPTRQMVARVLTLPRPKPSPSDPAPSEGRVPMPKTIEAFTAIALETYNERPAKHGWVDLSSLGAGLHARIQDFDPSRLGKAKLRTLIKATGAFEMQPTAHSIQLRPSGPGPKAH